MTTTTYTEKGREFLKRLETIAVDSRGDDIKKIRESLEKLKELQEEVDAIIEKFKNTYNVKNENVPPIMEMNRWAKPTNFESLEKILGKERMEIVQESLDIDRRGQLGAEEKQFALDLYNSTGGDVEAFMKKVTGFGAVTEAVRKKLKDSGFTRGILQKAGVPTATLTEFTNNHKKFISTVITRLFILDAKEIGESISVDFGKWFTSQKKETFPKYINWIKTRKPDPKVIKKFPQTKQEFMTRPLGTFPKNMESLFTMHSQKRKITGIQNGNKVPLPDKTSSLRNIYDSLPPKAKKNLDADMAFYKTKRPKKWKEYIKFIAEADEVKIEQITRRNTKGGRRPP